jgi:hypothetical protein
MTHKRYVIAAAMTLSLAATGLIAQSPIAKKETYKARLSAVPADARTRAALAGSGTATAVLEGTKISVTGSFEGLLSPASTANLHIAVAAGVRGPAVADVTIPKATSGTITGSVELTPPQIENFKKGGLYLEIHSEKAPEGVIWGWFVK